MPGITFTINGLPLDQFFDLATGGRLAWLDPPDEWPRRLSAADARIDLHLVGLREWAD